MDKVLNVVSVLGLDGIRSPYIILLHSWCLL
jgi:hypothetical protein